MAIPTDNKGRPAKPVSRWATALKILLPVGVYLCIAFCIRTVSEDKNSHAMRVSLPLLLGYGWLVDPGENYDPTTTKWGSLSTGVAVADGQILFVWTPEGDYALKMFDQTLEPERAKYEFIVVGQKGPIQNDVADGSRPVMLPACNIGWSGAQLGRGFLYLSDSFVLESKNSLQFGGPFRRGDLKRFQDGLPSGLQFSSHAWKINDMNGVKFDDMGFLQ